jgi:hypothetical protein
MMGYEQLPPELPTWQTVVEYQPACSMCRDLAGKDRAGVDDHQLCYLHLYQEYNRLKSEIVELKKTILQTSKHGAEVLIRCQKTFTDDITSTFRDEWININRTWFATFVAENMDKFKELDGELFSAAVAKWQKLYPGEPCPFLSNAKD